MFVGSLILVYFRILSCLLVVCIRMFVDKTCIGLY